MANLAVQNYRDEEKEQMDNEKREELRAELAQRRHERKNENRARRIEAARSSTDERTDEQKVQDDIDSVLEDVPVAPAMPKNGVKRHRRPPNWEDIADEAEIWGNDAALANFASDFDGASQTAKYQRLNQWKKDLKDKKVSSVYQGQPSYGSEIDLLLLADCHTRRAVGLPIDDVILRRMLIVHLAKAGKEGELIENGGKYHYGHSWAMRFYKRHKLASRVCTTKMRELPGDFEAKKATYLKVGAELIHKYNVPPELVINGDETAVLLVNRAKVTRNTVGAKRVRILGMGEDKAQITATIFVTETGDVLPYQMIFAGTTTRCHPKSVKPADCLWTNTVSHWQSVETYLELLAWAIVPYKNNTIRALGLPANQRTILKHDLHFTHKDARVLAYLKANFICPLYVPAGCTDIIQECDVVVNKPFKNAVRSAFRDHLDALFQTHLRAGRPPTDFAPKLTMGTLKPYLTSFVEKGILALKTPEMKASIRKSFESDGFFTEMRSSEMQLMVQMEGASLVEEDPAIEGIEDEENVEELDADSDAGADVDEEDI